MDRTELGIMLNKLKKRMDGRIAQFIEDDAECQQILDRLEKAGFVYHATNVDSVFTFNSEVQRKSRVRHKKKFKLSAADLKLFRKAKISIE